MFEWDDKYLVGDIFIDGEHQILFRLARQIAEGTGTIPAEEFKSLLMNIIEYTQVHFRHEEELLRDIQWDGFDRHRLQHQRIVAEIRELIGQNRDITSLQVKILRFLQRWIFDHVTHEDLQFRNDLFKARGFRR